MAAFGGLGFATDARAAEPTKPAAGEKLAKEQTLRYGGGGWFQNEPSSHDFNKDLYCSGVPALFAGLMVFNADFVSVPWMASKVESNKDGSVWTFTIRKDTPLVGQLAGHARATSSGRGSASSIPPPRRPTPRSSTTSRTARPTTRSSSPTRARSACAPRTTGPSR